MRREAMRALGAGAIALGVAFVIILLTSSAPLEAFSTLRHRADLARAHDRPVDRRRRQADHHRPCLQPGVPGPAVRDGRAGAGLCRRAGGQLHRAVAGRPDLARHSARRAVRDDGRRLLGLPARHRQGAARGQRDRLVADVQLHRDRAHQLSGADPAGAAGQRRADHQCLSADRGVPGAGPQHAHRHRPDIRRRRRARRLVRALPHQLGAEAAGWSGTTSALPNMPASGPASSWFPP